MSRADRNLNPSEIAAVGAHLLNPNNWISGKVIPVVGGGPIIV